MKAAMRQAGFTLIELMIAMALSLALLAALAGLFVNTSRSNSEMAKTNSLIENGRFSIQLLQEDLVHAGYWGGYLPEFDNLAATGIPGDVPSMVPDPCSAFNSWDATYRNAALGIVTQVYGDLAAETTCAFAAPQRPGTDVLVVRHAGKCVAGTAGCDADVPGRLYLQPSSCLAEMRAGIAEDSTNNSIELDANASSTDGDYVGVMLHTLAGAGAGQYRVITAYNGTSKNAVVSPNWTTLPDSTTTYAFEYALGTGAFPLHKLDCVGTGSPASLPVTAGTKADKRQFLSNIYYVSNIAHPDRAGEVVPTLVRSELDLGGGVIAQQEPTALIEGVEQFRIELGLDNISDAGMAVDYSAAIDWADPDNQTTPRNRGDGTPDTFIRCTVAVPCTAAQLVNVVAVNLYILARSREPTAGYTDDKTYCLGSTNADGSCPAANQVAAAGDSYKRHVFMTSVRLTNISGRRETP